MASRPDHRSLLGTTALTSFDPVIRAFIDDLRVREVIAAKYAGRYRGIARHFVVWLALTWHCAGKSRLHSDRAFSPTRLRMLCGNGRHLPGSVRGANADPGLLSWSSSASLSGWARSKPLVSWTRISSYSTSISIRCAGVAMHLEPSFCIAAHVQISFLGSTSRESDCAT